jgi:flavin-dependent dehydrogenase
MVSLWGSETPYETDFIFNPYGVGWRLDRRRFDALLARTAEACGATVYRGLRVTSCGQGPSGCWNVEARGEGASLHWEAKFLIDATGRASWLAQRLGVRRFNWDRLVGVVGSYGTPPEWTGDGRTLVEAVEEGWWYSALVPGGQLVVACMTDADALPAAPRDLGQFLSVGLRHTLHTRLRVPPGLEPDRVHSVFAGSSCLERVVGRQWLAVGDAAMTWDPLSGQGLQKALESGLHAAESIAKLQSSDPTALNAYQEWMSADFAAYLRSYASYYRAERRWPQSRFWQRRHQPARVEHRRSLLETGQLA